MLLKGITGVLNTGGVYNPTLFAIVGHECSIDVETGITTAAPHLAP